MKRSLLFLSILAYLFSVSIYAQTYNEEDKEGLRAILRQTGVSYNTGSPVYNVPVYSLFDLTESDTLTWTVSEDWIEKITSVSWHQQIPKQVRTLNWGRGQGVRHLEFDLSYFLKIDTVL